MRPATLRRYFDSEHALHDAMYAQGNQQLLERLAEQQWPDDLRGILHLCALVFIEFGAEDVQRSQLLFQRPIPGFEPSSEANAVAVQVFEQMRARFAAAGLNGLAHLDLWAALVAGVETQQTANDPGGDRWLRLVDEVVDLVERAAWAERERLLLAERSHIAAEMHDVLARGLSLMIGQANAVEMIAERDPETAARTARLMGDIGRQALTELRQILGVLRRDCGCGDSEESQPTVADIDKVLIEQSRAAGLPVTLEIDGKRRPVDELVESTAYRVVREALTNVHKHAGTSPTQVLLRYGADTLEIVVENARPQQRSSVGLPSSGFGLLGMRERVTAIGGTLSAGATDAGGFRLSVALPYDASITSPAAS